MRFATHFTYFLAGLIFFAAAVYIDCALVKVAFSAVEEDGQLSVPAAYIYANFVFMALQVLLVVGVLFAYIFVRMTRKSAAKRLHASGEEATDDQSDESVMSSDEEEDARLNLLNSSRLQRSTANRKWIMIFTAIFAPFNAILFFPYARCASNINVYFGGDLGEEIFEFSMRIYAALAGLICDNELSTLTGDFAGDFTDIIDMWMVRGAEVGAYKEGKKFDLIIHGTYLDNSFILILVAYASMFLRLLLPWLIDKSVQGDYAQEWWNSVLGCLVSLIFIEFPFLIRRCQGAYNFELPMSVLAVKNLMSIVQDLTELRARLCLGFYANDDHGPVDGEVWQFIDLGGTGEKVRTLMRNPDGTFIYLNTRGKFLVLKHSHSESKDDRGLCHYFKIVKSTIRYDCLGEIVALIAGPNNFERDQHENRLLWDDNDPPLLLLPFGPNDKASWFGPDVPKCSYKNPRRLVMIRPNNVEEEEEEETEQLRTAQTA